MIGLGLDLSLRNYATGISYVKANRVLDLTTPFSELTFTLEDKSGEGNDATLYSGRYIATDGVADKGIQANVTAVGSADYYVTGKVRPTGTSCRVQINDTASGEDDITGLTSAVWQDFTSATFSAQTASNVAIGWSSNSGFLAVACDWSDVRLINATTGATVARWQLNESADGDLNGYPALDSVGGYHGTHTGCAGGTGETTILQTAGMDWNKRMFFDGVDDVVTGTFAFNSSTDAYVQLTAYIVDATPSANQRLFSSGTGLAGANFTITHTTAGEIVVSVGFDGGGQQNFTSSATISSGLNKIRCALSGGNFITITVNDVAFDSGSITATTLGTGTYNYAIGRQTVSLFAYFTGIISNLDLNGQLEIDGYGSNDWGSATVNGTPSNYLIPASDTTPSNDALGNAIAIPRPTSDTWNLFGDAEYGLVADADSLDVTTEATWELWCDGSGATSEEYAFHVYDFGNGKRSWGFIFGSTYSTARRGIIRLGDASGLTAYVGSFDVGSGVKNISATFNAGTLIVYIDGVSVSVTTEFGAVPSAIFVTDTGIRIGATFAGLSPLARKIARPKIYNVALTADQVLQNYNAQKGAFGL